MNCRCKRPGEVCDPLAGIQAEGVTEVIETGADQDHTERMISSSEERSPGKGKASK